MDIIEYKMNLGSVKRHPWEIAKLKVIYKLINKIKSNNQLAQSSILDVGCGDLYLIKSLSAKFENVKLLGIDPAFTDDVVKEIYNDSKKDNIVLTKSLDEMEKRISESIDMVFLFDVIEHIDNDIGSLNELVKSPLISKNTYFIITVPAFNFLFSAHDKFLGHYRRYSNKSLKHNIESAGLEIVDIGYFFFSLIFPRIAIKMIEVFRKNNLKEPRGVSNWQHGKALSNIITHVLYFDFTISNFVKKIFNIKLPGLSNYVICKIKHV